MKVVVIGAGEVGYNIAKVMSDKNEVIVIENDAGRAALANELDAQVIVGNGANADVLKELPKFDLFVAVSNNDEINILSCMAAKVISQGKCKTIARVSSPDYIKKPVSQKSEVGVDVMVCPELSLASEIAELLYIRGAISVEVFAEGKVEMVEFLLLEDNPLIGQLLRYVRLNQICTVCAILRDGNTIIPNGNSVFMPLDRVIVIFRSKDIEKVEEIFSPKSKDEKRRRKKIFLIGCGGIGFYLANLIDKDPDIDLKIIEKSEERCLEIVDLLPHSLILNGDATDIDLLRDEGVGNSDFVVSVTDSDEKNLLCGLMAKHFGAKKVIGRTSQPDYIPVFEMVGFDVALSTRNATINEVLRLTLNTVIESLRAIPHAGSEILEYVVTEKSQIAQKLIRDLNFPKEAIISMIVRGDETIIPRGAFQVLPNDRVIVFSKPEAYSKLNKLFK